MTYTAHTPKYDPRSAERTALIVALQSLIKQWHNDRLAQRLMKHPKYRS